MQISQGFIESRFGLTHPLAPAVQETMRVELRESHCGMLPESMLDGMALAQRGRDAEMVGRMIAAAGDGAVLITGAGHARTDRGAEVRLALHQQRAALKTAGQLRADPHLEMHTRGG